MASNRPAYGAIALALILWGFATSVPARAEELSCAVVSARLAALNQASLDGTPHDRALALQRRKLADTLDESDRLGCGFSVAADAAPRCASLAGRKANIEARLAHLEGSSYGSAVSSERSHLMGLFMTQGCNRRRDEPSELRTAEAGAPTLRILGADDEGMSAVYRGADPNHLVISPSMSGIDPNGAYRTMCVRTCDGYYFPISYAVTPAQFTADQQACEARCPGADVRLYYHRVPEQDAEQMISVSDGTPYTAMPHAFLYRSLDRRPASACTCQQGGGYSTTAGATERGFHIIEPGESGSSSVEGSFITIEPQATPHPPASAPNTAPADVPSPAMPLRPTIEEAIRTTAPAEATPPASRKGPEMPRKPEQPVRVVGPKFFPDPSEAEVLRAPGPQPVR